MSTSEEFRDYAEGVLQTIDEALHRRGCFSDSENHLLDLAMYIHMQVCVERFFERTPVRPPELREIAAQILALPLVRRIVVEHPHIRAVDWTFEGGDVETLQVKLREMLEYLPKPAEASQSRTQGNRTSHPTPHITRSRQTLPRRSPIKKNLNPSERRAHTVAKIIEELDILKPGMTGSELDYDGLRRDHPRFLTFRIAGQHPELKEKVLSLQGNRRHFRLAQELVARKYGRELNTVQMDWKRHKPDKYRQGRKK